MLGGRVLQILGTWRVEGMLAVSRAIGDRRIKQYVSAVPDQTTVHRTDQHTRLVLASDGLWDTLSVQDACDLAGIITFSFSF